MSALLDSLWSADLLGPDRRDALRAIEPSTLEAILTRCALAASITVSRPGADPPWSVDLP
jgi:fructokinase